MPVCPDGSERQAGVPTVVTIDPLYAGSFMPPELAWVLPYLPFMQPFTLNLDDFCALGPPADPELTDADLINLMPPSLFTAVELAAYKLTQLVHIFAWYRFCRCSDGSTPDPAPTIDVPSPLPILNPPGQTSAPTGPCRTDVVTVDFPGGSESQTYYPGCVSTPCAALVVPTGANRLRATVQINNPDNNDVRADVFGLSANPYTTVTTDVVQIARAAHLGDYFNILDGFSNNNVWETTWNQPYFACHVSHTGGASPPRPTFSATFTLEWFCPNTVTPCIACPPDPFMLARLDQLMSALLETRTQVNLIQRQSVPFAYVYGDNHAGLTGDGELAVSGLLGVSVDCVTLPTSVGATSGTPEHLFDVGFVTLGTADGWLQSRRIDADGTLELARPGVGAITRVGYTLAPGVEVAIRELVREP